jgi:hypothetical protein
MCLSWQDFYTVRAEGSNRRDACGRYALYLRPRVMNRRLKKIFPESRRHPCEKLHMDVVFAHVRSNAHNRCEAAQQVGSRGWNMGL